MVEEVTNHFRNGGVYTGVRAYQEAAKTVMHAPAGLAEDVAGKMKQVRVAFNEGTTTNKVTVLGGVMTGVTLALQGVRNIRQGLSRDEQTGKRDLATAAVGAAETVGGLFVTALFYERLKLNSPENCESPSHSR